MGDAADRVWAVHLPSITLRKTLCCPSLTGSCAIDGHAALLQRPDGTPIAVMPFGSLAPLSEVDAQAVFAYLKTVRARPAGQRCGRELLRPVSLQKK
jgi:hypothetical protein